MFVYLIVLFCVTFHTRWGKNKPQECWIKSRFTQLINDSQINGFEAATKTRGFFFPIALSHVFPLKEKNSQGYNLPVAKAVFPGGSISKGKVPPTSHILWSPLILRSACLQGLLPQKCCHRLDRQFSGSMLTQCVQSLGFVSQHRKTNKNVPFAPRH